MAVVERSRKCSRAMVIATVLLTVVGVLSGLHVIGSFRVG
jgi:hypothetical protein